MDYQRLDGLRQGAYSAPSGGNVVITVSDFRWLVDQVVELAPPQPVEQVSSPESSIDLGNLE